MNKILMSLTIALASWTLMPASASAAGSCATVCTCSSLCAKFCDGGPRCGDYGVCNGGESCRIGSPQQMSEVSEMSEMSEMDLGEYSEEDQVCRTVES